MDTIVLTPRLKLTLIERAERGSQELDWLHELRSNEQSTWWSIRLKSENIEDTYRVTRSYIPSDKEEEKTYRVAYAVHERLNPSEGSDSTSTRFIGLVTISSLNPGNLVLPDHLSPSPATALATKTLVTEIAYMFLPLGWGKGYATEAVRAVLDACKRATSYWQPYDKVYVRSIVNADNPRSTRVMEKSGMKLIGAYVWTGKPIWLAGQWQYRSELQIYGHDLFE